jgi:signal transduction histidine kinase
MAISHAHQSLIGRVRVPPRAAQGRLALAGLLVSVATVALAAAGAPADAAFGRGLLQFLVVAGPISVGLYALRAPGNTAFGVALLAIGFAWSLTALAESTNSVLFTIGRLSTWLTFPCVVYLLLAFPNGRVQKGLDRALLIALVAIMIVLFYGTAPFVQAFPPKTLWSTCTTDCPANAVFVLDAQPAFLSKLIYVREWLVELLWLGLFWSMFRRHRAASPLQRQAMGPAFVAGAALGLCHYAHITARQLGAPADAVVALSSAWTLAVVAVCAGFLYGLVRRRMLLAGALARLGVALRAGDDRAHLRNALSTALDDATLDLLVRDGQSGGWEDARGRSTRWPPTHGPDRAVTTIDAGDSGDDIALIHDVALLDDPELLAGVSGMVLAGRRSERLATALGGAMRELEDSRRRLVEAADLERARLERDLHDGAQQRLIALRIRLTLAEERLKNDAVDGIEAIHDLGFDVDRALEELRSLAHGVYPPVLTDLGLAAALHSMATQAPLPVHVAGEVGRHSVEIESAVYFASVEALQNALKHADGATGVWIELRESGDELRFEVRDDGAGFTAGEHDGRGLRNMRDRVEAIGGHLTIRSQPGTGTRVSGSVALAS